MTRSLLFVALAASTVSTAWAADPIEYKVLRYTGFGVANPARNQKVIDDFKKALETNALLSSKFSQPTDPATRMAQLQGELATPLPSNASRAEQLRRKAREHELERLKRLGVPDREKALGADTVVLVDTLPEGIDIKDGRITANGPAALLGRFTARTRTPNGGAVVDEAALISELKVLAAAAGGNIIVLSLEHGDEPQGRCRGAVGLVIKHDAFDPGRVTQGRLPNEI
jgi:hypothetical protein